ncbi:bifunctional tRNA (5-methylaminomethyl-2-thiouridine)(34)-methyltransferase MnmD/FAD-dependent 5-carboxymethylaminomethyl-2-thiouridine(34) oxidoreductase MnmC [Vibrio sp. SM6]|uniref:tRNA 5-methylaminomethyl-2-thiouridine biosynthesis bifunctional protein MnmC n=1 Tax=Vibrio agarilyticus TaxID=2726741 RepID=A0A7X8TRI0_9VIBR|nr:bifunctional tRNA (5-methylaminomethyl-2-thiouridine)(34)-methyltransferase MnmD/FAD-dependent 5-carboxymethylaminomethyl-2-thiouridine(34) oxidoreductase MnmC [Vibrio agarilyticus]NLS13277.1 bifunctional tRNA (5-methylaminomethyl-2-thiouridine)(34)-methyltransferase MnmD/FAD-dependent 5-carboxymethylaminomethyl-2-thiouridine(34) oxidoreductase MnmC [Vibrio agarilyticus]
MTKNSITNATLDWNESGTPVSEQFDDVYFSNVNGLAETQYVFLTQNQIPERWQSFEPRRFVIAETGFGTGLNFLAVWRAFDQFRAAHPSAVLTELHFISFEKYPLSREDLALAHRAWPELADYAAQLQQHYPLAVPECHRVVLAGGAITLDLWFGDIKDCLPKVPNPTSGVVDAWFLDGFAPSKNPEMWNQTLFNGMAALAKTDCTCATFTAAGFVRRGLIDAGFAMRKVKGFGTKREMIAGKLEARQLQTNMNSQLARPSAEAYDDIAIIGGGIASAALIRALQRRGKQVTLYCQDSAPAQGASGNRQGAVYPLLNGQHTPVSRIFSAAFVYARQFAIQASEQFDYDHDWCGVTQLKWNDKSTQKLNTLLKGQFPIDLVTGLNVEQTNQHCGLPIGVDSIHYPLGGWLSPAQLTQGLIQHAQNHSTHPCQTHFNCTISALDFNANTQQWQLTSSIGVHQHQVVIIANGHQFSSLTPTASLPLGQVKGQVSHIPTTENLAKLRNVLCYDGYMTPANINTQQHCIGASYDREHLDLAYDDAAQHDNRDKLAHCLPEQSWVNEIDISAQDSRQGIRCVSRDHLPFVGNISDPDALRALYADINDSAAQTTLPSYPQLYALLGLGSRGLSSAPLMAELLASQICGDPLPLAVDLLDALHPSRMWVRKLRKGQEIETRN